MGTRCRMVRCTLMKRCCTIVHELDWRRLRTPRQHRQWGADLGEQRTPLLECPHGLAVLLWPPAHGALEPVAGNYLCKWVICGGECAPMRAGGMGW